MDPQKKKTCTPHQRSQLPDGRTDGRTDGRADRRTWSPHKKFYFVGNKERVTKTTVERLFKCRQLATSELELHCLSVRYDAQSISGNKTRSLAASFLCRPDFINTKRRVAICKMKWLHSSAILRTELYCSNFIKAYGSRRRLGDSICSACHPRD